MYPKIRINWIGIETELHLWKLNGRNIVRYTLKITFRENHYFYKILINDADATLHVTMWYRYMIGMTKTTWCNSQMIFRSIYLARKRVYGTTIHISYARTILLLRDYMMQMFLYQKSLFNAMVMVIVCDNYSCT